MVGDSIQNTFHTCNVYDYIKIFDWGWMSDIKVFFFINDVKIGMLWEPNQR